MLKRLLLSLWLACTPACAAEQTPETLPAALARAAPGATLELAPGFYGRLLINRGMTIRGGREAVLSGVVISGADGVRLEGVTVRAGPSQTHNDQAVRIVKSSNVTLSGLRIVGGLATNGIAPTEPVLDKSRNVRGLPSGKGVNVHESRNVTIVRSDISLFHKGITFAKVGGLRIVDNDIHDLRTSPISGGGGSDVEIARNHSWTSTPWSLGGKGDHGDMVHLWTVDGPSTNVRITQNLFEQGKGAALLGIYLDDNKRGLGFTGVEIAENVLVNSDGQGIRLENVAGAVRDNMLLWSGEGDWKKHPRIGLHDETGAVRLTGNRAAAITGNPEGNRTGPLRAGEARDAVQAWLAKHRSR